MADTMSFIQRVSMSFEPPQAFEDDEDAYYGALTHVKADVLLDGQQTIGSISAILLDRLKIPENCFYETFDEHSSDLEWIGTLLLENRYGRTKLQSLQPHDDPKFNFMYITSFHINDTVTANRSDIASAALHNFLHEPTNIKDNLKSEFWNVSLAAYAVCAPNNPSKKRKRDDQKAKEADARAMAEPFLRNGFFQDSALVREDSDNQRLLVASYEHWSQGIQPPPGPILELKFYSEPPKTAGKDNEIFQVVKRAVLQRHDRNNLAAIMLGQATHQPSLDPVSEENLGTLRSELKRLQAEGGSIARSTALHKACEKNSPNLVKLLLDLDPEAINVPNQGDCFISPLMAAAKNAGGRLSINGIDDTNVLDHLLAAGADKTLTDSVGLTAYDHFCKKSAQWVDLIYQGCRPKLTLVESKLRPSTGPSEVNAADENGGRISGFVDYMAPRMTNEMGHDKFI